MWVLYRSQLEVVPRNQVGGRLMSTGGSTGRSNHAFHLQHHQSSLSALHMATTNNSSTIEKRHSSLRSPSTEIHCFAQSINTSTECFMSLTDMLLRSDHRLFNDFCGSISVKEGSY
ncbi:hypothetical protein PV325_008720 [Microctonus aethiopoides]|nr:hypothetical protein PV325_008720 [Microctonus aethiopoides]KAK0096831.1 hypothetical protein PV326_004180 [Microctonus aethiopoides]